MFFWSLIIFIGFFKNSMQEKEEVINLPKFEHILFQNRFGILFTEFFIQNVSNLKKIKMVENFG